ncbi:MAG: response regulator [Candidatus Pacebacteria bacterium]|nr:response regulator [Candidatus Paceibacterota bacterium]
MAEQQTILLVDDEHEFCELLRMRLESDGYCVQTAENGEDGLAQAVDDPPHLILLDVMMPGIDGIETLQRLKADERTKHVPVIMLTAKGDAKSVFAAKKHGGKAYLVKPCLPGDLLDQVRRNILR